LIASGIEHFEGIHWFKVEGSRVFAFEYRNDDAWLIDSVQSYKGFINDFYED